MAYVVEMTWSDGVVDKLSNDATDNLANAISLAEDELTYAMDIDGNRVINTAVINEQNGLKVWKSNDAPELKAYEEYTYSEWHSLMHGHHEKSDKPSVYFDIDGTLGYWYADGRGLEIEEILDPTNHYFRDIEPHEMMVGFAKELQNRGIDVCVISAADKDTIRDKWEWVENNLPFIPKENICFSPLGTDKSEFVKGNAEISFLIDDYNKNLDEWKGVAIKAINTVNSHQSKFYEIDFTNQEALIKNARENLLMDDAQEDIIATFCSAVVKEVAGTIDDQIEKNSLKREYEAYKEEWITDHVSKDLQNQTEAAYENCDEAKDMTFKEVVEKFGYADGSCYASFDEFCDNELPLRKLADGIEQFMYERGEYNYTNKIQWIEIGSDEDGFPEVSDKERIETAKNILDDLQNDPSPLIEYFKDEVATIDNEDELLVVAKDMLGKLMEQNGEQENDEIDNPSHETCKHTDASNPALKGWKWADWNDGSGSLKNASSETVFRYDLQTSEIKIGENWSYTNSDLNGIKAFAENKFAKETLQNEKTKKSKTDIERD